MMPKCNCKAFDKCFEFQHEQRKIVTCSDAGSSKTKYVYYNKNGNNLSKYRVDNCLIIGDNTKCDYLLLNCEQKQSYFIELKGSDIIRAIKQIDRSIEILKSNLIGFSFYARIVVTRVNTIDTRDTRYLKFKKKLKSLGGDVKEQSGLFHDVN